MLGNEQLRQAREDVATRDAEIDELKHWLQHRIKTLVGVSTSIEVLPPDSIERTLTGKARRVQDLRKP